MRVFVVRHGESENNRNRLWTGWFDALLTDKGIDDARKVGEILKNISFGKIYASDLKRAKKTAEIAITGCEYETVTLLREYNVGTLSNKPLSTLTDEERKEALSDGYSKFGGETNVEFKNRVRRFMKKLEQSDCENVCVFTHGGWLRGMLDLVLGVCLPRKNICCNNCTVAIFEYNNEGWKLYSWINLT